MSFRPANTRPRISDLSLGGCYVDSIASVMEGEAISLIITVGSGEPQRLTGVVAYLLQGFGFGVRFTDLTPEQIEVLNKLIG